MKLTEKYTPEKYPKYANFDAINVDSCNEIPSDYFGLMGVPQTFLAKWNPKQFELFTVLKGECGRKVGVKVNPLKGHAVFLGDYKNPIYIFDRILIKRRTTKNSA